MLGQGKFTARVEIALILLLLAIILLSQSNEITKFVVTEQDLEEGLETAVVGPQDDSLITYDVGAEEEEEADEDGNNSTTGDRYYVNEFNQTVKLWKWFAKKQQILYIKIPKTGGTTLADNLARLAKHSHWVMAKPNERAMVDTCGSIQDAEKAWNYMIIANGGKIGAFASHACYRSFMLRSRYWSQKRTPHLITLMRHPWDHFISKYRFAKVCCELKHWAWCEVYCPKQPNGNRTVLTHTRFADIACRHGRCNEQRFYMGSGQTSRILDEYNLVLLLDRFDEGLAMLSLRLGIPFQALPYLRENTNTLVKMPHFPDEYREKVLRQLLNLDYDMYLIASNRFDDMVKGLNPMQRARYNETYTRLKQVNAHLQSECEKQCGMYVSFGKPRKLCDNACIERVLGELR